MGLRFSFDHTTYYYLGNSNEFDEAIASFAVTYADKNERDYKDFLKAIRAGKIEVYNEV